MYVKYNWRRHTPPHKGAIFDLFWNFAIQTGADFGAKKNTGESGGIVKNYDGEMHFVQMAKYTLYRWRNALYTDGEMHFIKMANRTFPYSLYVYIDYIYYNMRKS